MRKLINTAFFYAILAMIAGVFFREFTKALSFTGVTTLAFLHVHLFVLGMIFFLILLALEKNFNILEQKFFKAFYWLYNIGLLGMVTMLTFRGITQAQELSLSSGIDSAISGISGLFHIILGVAIILFFLGLKKNISHLKK